jgi:hypothetical protein
MIRVNLFGFYELGAALGRLDDITEGAPATEFFLKAWYARVNLETVLESKIIPLGASRKSGEDLFKAVEELWFSLTAPGGRESKTITNGEAYAIATSKKEFETVLAAEMPGLATFFVQKKAIFDTVDLIERADRTIDADLAISGRARADLKQAGRCLAFELWTATGFHVFRAIESVIVEYYDLLTGGKKPLKEEDRSWGTYIKLLDDNGADKKITGYLRHFKDNYRNPGVHPEVSLDKGEAIAVFQSTSLAIVPMAKAIAAAKAAP